MHDLPELSRVLFIGSFGAQLRYPFPDLALHSASGSALALSKSHRGSSQASRFLKLSGKRKVWRCDIEGLVGSLSSGNAFCQIAT